MTSTYTYKAFISYSHAGDGRLAPALEQGLHRFAKPWYRIRAMRIFRDETTLALTHELWPAIEAALAQSEYFLLLASPDAADSYWVKQEISYWLENRDPKKLLIILTGGELVWDRSAGDFDWDQTTALPSDADHGFSSEPLYLDLRWGRTAEQLSLTSPDFRSAVADLASVLLDRPKDELVGEDVRQHARTRRILWTGVSALALLAIAATVAAIFAVLNQREAERQTVIAEERRRQGRSRQLGAQARSELQAGRLDRALLLSLEAHDPPHVFEARSALLTALSTNPQLVAYARPGADVRDVAFSPDGKLLATSHYKHIFLWDAATHEIVARLDAPDTGSPTGPLSFSSDGRLLASGGQRLTLWDVERRSPLARWPEQRNVHAVAFSPIGSSLALGGGDHVPYLWGAGSETDPVPLGEDSGGNVSSLDFGPDGKQLLSGSHGRVAVLWDVDSRAQILEIPYKGQVEAVAFHPGAPLIAIGQGRVVDIYDIESGKQRGEPMEHGSRVDTLAFSGDRRLLAAAGNGADWISLWDMANQAPLGEPLRGHTSWITELAFASNGMLASGSDDRSLIFWNPRPVHRLGRPAPESLKVARSLAISPDGRLLAVGGCVKQRQGGAAGLIRIWKLQASTGEGHRAEPLGEPLSGHTGCVQTLAFRTSAELVTASCSGFTSSWSCDGAEIRSWEPFSREPLGVPTVIPGSGMDRLVLSPDGRLLATAARSEKTVRLWNVATGEPAFAPFTGLEGLVTDVVFGPDDRGLAASHINHGTMVWDLSPPLPRYAPLAGGRPIFTPDGQFLVTVNKPLGEAATLEVWDAATGKITRRMLTALTEVVTKVALTRDGRTLAVGDTEGTIAVWDLETGRALGNLLGAHEARVSGLVFARDDQLLVSSDRDGRVFLWDLSFESWRRRACHIAGQNLSYAEWVQFLGPDEPYRPTCAEWPLDPGLLEAARELASAGQVERARTLFAHAAELGVDIDPEEELHRLAVAGLLEQGRNLAATYGNIEGAVALLEQAGSLDPTMSLDPRVEARKQAAPLILKRALTFAEIGQIDDSLEVLARAQEYDAAVEVSGAAWATFCLQAALYGRAVDVMDLCDRAVASQEKRRNRRYERGLAHAMSGDLASAARDFRDHVATQRPRNSNHPGSIPFKREVKRLDRIERWAAALEGGENPFTAEILEGLRSESR